MREAVHAVAPAADVVVMAAAVADYTLAQGSLDGKIERQADGGLELRLVPTVDILAELGRQRAGSSRPVLIGFAAESGDPVARGREKLRRKGVDVIVANDITRPDSGFDSDSNAATMVSAEGAEHDEVFPHGPKTALAATNSRSGRAPARSRDQKNLGCARRRRRASVVRWLAIVDNAQLAEHLRFFQELGVSGVSRDARWQRRESAPQSAPAPLPEVAAAEPAPATAVEEKPFASSAPAEPAPVPMTLARNSPDREEALQQIRAEIGDCTRCKLHRLGRKQIVFGVGNPNADLMFVGEAPGADEDIQGFPFVGRAGQLLTKIIEAIGLRRDDVYIANVIKCRPPENRNPEPDEVETCEPFLFQQIDSIQPKVIVALGTFAAKALLKTQDPISRLRGRAFDYRGATLIPTFHPAFLLRSPDRKRDVWEDMKKVRALLQTDSATTGSSGLGRP